jgi:DNA-damage-inducible protein D
MTQTRDKLARENINSQHHAIQAHEQVGKEVRAAIERIGGTPPEKITPAEHIKEVEKRIKDTVPKMQLADKDAGGLLGKENKK